MPSKAFIMASGGIGGYTVGTHSKGYLLAGIVPKKLPTLNTVCNHFKDDLKPKTTHHTTQPLAQKIGVCELAHTPQKCRKSLILKDFLLT